MLLEWSVLKWKEKVALKNRKSAGADRSRVCVVGVGLYENPLFIDNLSYPIMNTVHGHNCFLNNYSAKDLTVNTLLYTVKPRKIKGWGRRPPVYYPIWWGIAAWPTDGFVEANDFTGKTVIPFCTSASSGLGESGELLSELAGTGDWQEGMRFRSSASEADVQEWLDSLNLS